MQILMQQTEMYCKFSATLQNMSGKPAENTCHESTNVSLPTAGTIYDCIAKCELFLTSSFFQEIFASTGSKYNTINGTKMSQQLLGLIALMVTNLKTLYSSGYLLIMFM